jgi:riboflavin kinase / FMN adenylyltransferase
MMFQSRHIKGHGRGKGLGFPTVNLLIPKNFNISHGVYAARVTILGEVYKGALHYGPIPTFGDTEKSLEVYLLDVTDENTPNTDGVDIEFDIVERIRGIRKFDSAEDLSKEIAQDVEKVKRILS